MIYKIQYDINIEKYLKNIPKPDAKSILEKINLLSKNPRPNGSIKLINRPFYRLRVRNYRVIYAINDHELIVLIIDVDDRKDVYRK